MFNFLIFVVKMPRKRMQAIRIITGILFLIHLIEKKKSLNGETRISLFSFFPLQKMNVTFLRRIDYATCLTLMSFFVNSCFVAYSCFSVMVV